MNNTISVAAATAVDIAPIPPFNGGEGPVAIPVAIGESFGGGIYAGIIQGPAGHADMHLVLLPGDVVDVGWGDASEWARAVGGDLPCLREQRLLAVNLKEYFYPEWYWSSAHDSASSDQAWAQHFGNENQQLGEEANKCRARAVRRLPVEHAAEIADRSGLSARQPTTAPGPHGVARVAPTLAWNPLHLPGSLTYSLANDRGERIAFVSIMARGLGSSRTAAARMAYSAEMAGAMRTASLDYELSGAVAPETVSLMRRLLDDIGAA
ncbi:hypothetical protein JAB1_46620 [Janthinobacterium sp. MP5059B]|uniref:hypothetical protein n=1 Tax=Janthinobacterium sp. MP5059B TaxID=1766683 RepID=UPI000875109D|nr:hypothetical protein [Janthinobacterium sp. MP5059B]OEZ46724.1 hypothetical protein JAB1_46620 [Janthinobacterium sp. MP5059B]